MTSTPIFEALAAELGTAGEDSGEPVAQAVVADDEDVRLSGCLE